MDYLRYARYWSRRLAPGLRREDREDLEQFIAYRLWRAYLRFDRRVATWGTYAEHISRRAVTTYFKSEFYKRDLVAEIRETPYYDDTTNFEFVESLKDWPEKEKRIAVCMVLGLNESETARAIAISVQTVRRTKLRLLNHWEAEKEKFSTGQQEG